MPRSRTVATPRADDPMVDHLRQVVITKGSLTGDTPHNAAQVLVQNNQLEKDPVFAGLKPAHLIDWVWRTFIRWIQEAFLIPQGTHGQRRYAVQVAA